MLMMFMLTPPLKKLSVNVLLLFDVKCTMTMDMNTMLKPGLVIEKPKTRKTVIVKAYFHYAERMVFRVKSQ